MEHRLGHLGFLQAGNEINVFNIKRHHFLLIFNSHVLSTTPRATHLARLLQSAAQRRVRDEDAMVADTELDCVGGTATSILRVGWGAHLTQTAHLLLFSNTRTPGRGVSAWLQNVFSKKSVTHFLLYTCKQDTNRKLGPKLLSVIAALEESTLIYTS